MHEFHNKCLLSLTILLAATSLGTGCTSVPNQYADDGPAAVHPLKSPTSADVKARFTAAPPRQRDWDLVTVGPEPQAVTHWPLYFEDPFEDKGTTYANRLGWEDWVAMPYCYVRYTLNWLMLPVSAVVTPPWTLMESDGNLSQQALGPDHDAARAGHDQGEPDDTSYAEG